MYRLCYAQPSHRCSFEITRCRTCKLKLSSNYQTSLLYTHFYSGNPVFSTRALYFLVRQNIVYKIRPFWKTSVKVNVKSEVAQGTVPGPLVFLVYINDFPGRIKSNIRLFADDSYLYRIIKTQRMPNNFKTIQTQPSRMSWRREGAMLPNNSENNHRRRIYRMGSDFRQELDVVQRPQGPELQIPTISQRSTTMMCKFLCPSYHQRLEPPASKKERRRPAEF